MHELAIVENILESIIPKAEGSGAKKILEIRMKIGEMSGIVLPSLEECFRIASEGTFAEGAKLTVETVPPRIFCNDCGYEGTIDRKKIECPACGSLNFKVTAGREYIVDSLLVE